MAKRLPRFPLLCAGLVLSAAAATPAQALRSITYQGTADIRFETSSHPDPGALNGTVPVSARFYYTDAGTQVAASIFAAGVLREHFVFCPGWPAGYCPPLALTPTSVGSGTGTTPEDYVSAGVTSPGGFGGVSLLSASRRTYVLGPDDSSSLFVSWALFDNATGFAWNSGSGSVSQIVTSVPEPAAWALLLTGFGLIGIAVRRQAPYNSPSATSR